MKKSGYELASLARLDLVQIWQYWTNEESSHVADRLLADIEKGLEFLVRFPRAGHVREDLTNRPLLFYRVHTYFIIYRALEAKPLEIARVIHTARDIHKILAQ